MKVIQYHSNMDKDPKEIARKQVADILELRRQDLQSQKEQAALCPYCQHAPHGSTPCKTVVSPSRNCDCALAYSPLEMRYKMKKEFS